MDSEVSLSWLVLELGEYEEVLRSVVNNLSSCVIWAKLQGMVETPGDKALHDHQVESVPPRP